MIQGSWRCQDAYNVSLYVIGIVINSVIKFRINFIIVIKKMCIGFSNVV